MTKTFNKLDPEIEKEFDDLGFRNQAIIKGFKRIEIKQFLVEKLEKKDEEIKDIKESIRKLAKMAGLPEKVLKYLYLSKCKTKEKNNLTP